MESPGDKMEDIYALPPKLKYTESWLEFKEKRGFTNYWVVLKGTYMFFFKDQNTHAKEQYVGFIGIQVRQTTCTSKKGSEREFIMEMGKKKYRLRANDDILRRRWIHAIDLINRADAPGPLPGDLDFKETRDPTPSPSKLKKRANTVAGIPLSQLPRSPLSSFDDSSINSTSPREDLSSSLEQQLSVDDQAGQQTYDPVFVMPSWFYPDITRGEAEQLLNHQQYGAYLLRPTDKSKDRYVLSIKDIEKIRHHKILLVSDHGRCIFESSPNAPFPSPVLAVDYLMRTKYAGLNPQPITSGEGRNSGDGQEDVDQQKEETKRSASENPYVVSPSSSFPNGRSSFEESPIDEAPLLPRPPRISTSSLPSPPYTSALPSPPSAGRVAPGWRQTSLPARLRMKDRPLPDLPIYENAQAILKHSRSNGDSYLDMHGTSFNEYSFDNNDNCFHEEEEEEIPPPLPRKRNSLPRCPTYENVPRPGEVIRSEYDAPKAYSTHQSEMRKWSHP